MAEFCLDCMNLMSKGEQLTENGVVMDFDLCEECGEWKQCVICVKPKTFTGRLKRRIFAKISKIRLDN